MNKNQLLKAYSIKDVSKKINVPTGTIRQWEKDLNGLLVIPRSRQGARFYTDTEIMLLAKIKEMREKNLSKDMIRILMTKHMAGSSETDSESLALKPVDNSPAVQSVEQTPAPAGPNLDELFSSLETYKQNLLSEIKTEIKKQNRQMLEEVQNGIHESSLRTVQGLSKSISRANERRKTELTEIAESITDASIRHSETVASLSESIAKSSKGTYEQLSKRISESSKTASKDYKSLITSASSSLDKAQKDLIKMTRSLQEDQETLVDSFNKNMEQFNRNIQEREDVFQDMVTSFREVAAAKNNKKWWKIF
ncbi:MerR family transcriptional regulator [Peribacillus sp. SCS-26]|uniref:MerR family transcriptional regulator n=1 Tax=Paraperibacillus marinus TaxID=3115295 RepID=UPI00390678FA